MKTALAVLVVIGMAAAAVLYYTMQMAGESSTVYRAATIQRGDLLSTISATGTVEPEEVVDVGAQVAGKIESFGRNPDTPDKTIDFGSIVHKGTVLANIDPTIYKAQVDQAEATLRRARADLEQLRAKRAQTEQEWRRAESLRPTKAIADTDYDLAVANFKVADANVTVGEAAIEQSAASLRLAKTNLDYTIIKSPVEGVIIARRVNIGQTVVSSLSAPSLFLIAKDLRRIQVWASVNEADIGRIRLDMPVRFTVDAYPGETFRGKVMQIRLNAAMTQNVVTYTVVVVTDNLDGRLLPYLTANLQFEVEQRTGVLLAPNTALRWKPRAEQIDPQVRGAVLAAASADKSGKSQTGTAGKDSSEAAKSAKKAKARNDSGRLWIDFDGFVRPMAVTVGASDGSMTEISGDGLKEGMKVVIGEESKSNLVDAAGETTNPFAPKLFNKKK